MGATTGALPVEPTTLDDWLAERDLSIGDVSAGGKARDEFIDFVTEQRGRELIPPDPVREEIVTGLPPAPVPRGAPPPPPRGLSIPLPNISGISGGVVSAVTGALAGPFGVIADVVGAITGQIRELAEATIPTISELALGIVSGVSNALDFIGDNLVEVSDFAGALASALITPLEALAEVVGERARDFILSVIGLIFRALGGLRAVLPEITMERPI